MSIAGRISRAELAREFKNDRLVKTFDAMQDIVFGSAINSLGTVIVSATAANRAVPITIDGTVYYIKLSTTP